MKCGARKRNGGTCDLPAGWGTDSDRGPCKKHGGLLPGPRKSALKAEALAYAAEHFGTTDITPADALLAVIQDTAGQVVYFKREVADLDEVFEGGKLHPAVSELIKAQERKAHWADRALALGLAERQVRLAERMGELLSGAMERVLDALDLSPKDRARAVRVFSGALAELEAGDEVVDAEVVA